MLSACTGCVPNSQVLEYLPGDELEMQRFPSEVAGKRHSSESALIRWALGMHMLKNKEWAGQLRWRREVWRKGRDMVLCKTSEVFLCEARRPMALKAVLFILLCTVSQFWGHSCVLLISSAEWRDSHVEVHPCPRACVCWGSICPSSYRAPGLSVLFGY